MLSTGIIGILMMKFVSLVGGELTDSWQIVAIISNVFETAFGLLILGILALIYLLGLIPNPFPWIVFLSV